MFAKILVAKRGEIAIRGFVRRMTSAWGLSRPSRTTTVTPCIDRRRAKLKHRVVLEPGVELPIRLESINEPDYRGMAR